MSTIADAHAAEIHVIASPGVREAYNELVPQFEKKTGNKVVIIWDGVANTTRRVAGGETADVVILPVAQISELTGKGRLAKGQSAAIAKSGIGVAVRTGAAHPDISSGEKLKQALIKAKSISYSTGPSGVHLTALIKGWGLTDMLKAKTIVSPPDTPVGVVVARGDAEIGFQQVSELIHIKGIDLLGPMPADVQEITVFAAAVHANAKEPEAAKALVNYLSAPESASAFRRAGMEPGT